MPDARKPPTPAHPGESRDPSGPSAPIPLTDQITCVRREIAMRRRVYPRWVGLKRMTQPDADEEIARMEAVLATLEALRSAAHASNEETSPRVAALAARGLADPASLTPAEVQSVCASALTQREP